MCPSRSCFGSMPSMLSMLYGEPKLLLLPSSPSWVMSNSRIVPAVSVHGLLLFLPLNLKLASNSQLGLCSASLVLAEPSWRSSPPQSLDCSTYSCLKKDLSSSGKALRSGKLRTRAWSGWTGRFLSSAAVQLCQVLPRSKLPAQPLLGRSKSSPLNWHPRLSYNGCT